MGVAVKAFPCTVFGAGGLWNTVAIAAAKEPVQEAAAGEIGLRRAGQCGNAEGCNYYPMVRTVGIFLTGLCAAYRPESRMGEGLRGDRHRQGIVKSVLNVWQ